MPQRREGEQAEGSPNLYREQKQDPIAADSHLRQIAAEYCILA
jgi:hypothetical protein